MSVNHYADQIAEAERWLAHWQQRINRVGATLEDEHAYQCARNRLLTVQLKAANALNSALRRELRPGHKPVGKRKMTALERAESVFSGGHAK